MECRTAGDRSSLGAGLRPIPKTPLLRLALTPSLDIRAAIVTHIVVAFSGVSRRVVEDWAQ